VVSRRFAQTRLRIAAQVCPQWTELPTKEAMMHFIEDIFGISPDGGSGLSELLMVSAAIAIGVLFVYFRRIRKASAK
jgi:hypothetical protein